MTRTSRTSKGKTTCKAFVLGSFSKTKRNEKVTEQLSLDLLGSFVTNVRLGFTGMAA